MVTNHEEEVCLGEPGGGAGLEVVVQRPDLHEVAVPDAGRALPVS
jgi:hypothetical protein